MGRLIRKHHRHVVDEAIAPPIRGPEAAAIAHVAPISEVQYARSLTSQYNYGIGSTEGKLYLI